MTDLDEVLERFQRGALEYGGGLSNHGPMMADALVALGHPALLTGLVDFYAPRLPPFEPGRPLSGPERAGALGASRRAADWVATWEHELAARDWQEVLTEALRWLAPGLFAGAGHAWLRVAHAVRALGRGETAPRRRELAFGLGYWASAYHPLPGEPGSAPARPAVEVLQCLAPVAAARQQPGSFDDRVRVLADEPGFAAAIGSADFGAGDPLDAVAALCREGARLYLLHPSDRIAYAHAVTVPGAVRLVAPWIDDETVLRLAGYAFQSAAALHAISSRGDVGLEAAPSCSGEVEALARTPDEIRYRAACSLHEHAIKLAEACLREDAIAPDRGLRLAAADAALALEG